MLARPLIALASVALTASAVPVAPPSQPPPVVSYVLKLSPADSGVFDVTMRITNAPSVLRLAMAVHPEYNQRYWRFVRDISAEAGGQPLTVRQERHNIWAVTTSGGAANVRYRIELQPEDPGSHAAWHSFLGPVGAHINTTDTFLYPLDFPDQPSRISLDIPAGWQVVTPLARGSNPRELTARNSYDLVDSPIMVGNLRVWSFSVAGIAHRVAYLPLPNAASFDTAEFVGSVRRFTESTFELFGGAPYSHYTFLFQDGAWGGLEHTNSASIGAQSADLARNPRHYMGEIAHEFFHTWNLMALDPQGPNRISAEPPLPLRELWFSEGITMYFAETLMRRSRTTIDDQSRSDELAGEIASYYANAANTIISPERGSWASVYGPDSTEYFSNYYTQGRLIAEVLDIVVRDSTQGRRGMRDVMRAMYSRYAGKGGYTGRDVERVVNEVCGCNVTTIFEDHVRNARPIDINRYLRSLGLEMTLEMLPAADTAGTPYPDLRISAYQPESGRMRVHVMHPNTVWRAAGLRTGMDLVAVKGIPIDSFPDFRRAIRSIRIGETVPVDVIDSGTPRRIEVRVGGYTRPRIRIVERADATPAQKRRRHLWEVG